MPQVVSKNFGVQTAQELIRDSLDNRANTYLVFAKVEPWANDASPNTPLDNTQNYVNLWRSAVGGKRITGNDMITAVPRVNWTANTVYNAYSDIAQTEQTNFYVLTSDFNVYKCIFNNNGANSTVKPTYNSPDQTSREADGYIWKYMLTLSTSDRVRFLSNDYIPIKTLSLNDGSLQWQVQQAAIDGSLNAITISNSGINYTNSANVSATIAGDGTLATAIVNLNTTTNSVANLIITEPGSGYHYANVSISGGGGTGAAAQVVISPFGGHGSDPASELGASNVIINTRLEGTEDDTFLVGNDFRQFGLILNPLRFASNTAISNATFNQTTTVLVSAGAGSYVTDEYVFQGGSLSTAVFSGRVVSFDSSNNKLFLTETSGSPTSAALQGATSSAVRFLISLTNPATKPFSGKVLYINNITPVTRATDQTEDIKLVIQF